MKIRFLSVVICLGIAAGAVAQEQKPRPVIPKEAVFVVHPDLTRNRGVMVGGNSNVIVGGGAVNNRIGEENTGAVVTGDIYSTTGKIAVDSPVQNTKIESKRRAASKDAYMDSVKRRENVTVGKKVPTNNASSQTSAKTSGGVIGGVRTPPTSTAGKTRSNEVAKKQSVRIDAARTASVPSRVTNPSAIVKGDVVTTASANNNMTSNSIGVVGVGRSPSASVSSLLRLTPLEELFGDIFRSYSYIDVILQSEPDGARVYHERKFLAHTNVRGGLKVDALQTLEMKQARKTCAYAQMERERKFERKEVLVLTCRF